MSLKVAPPAFKSGEKSFERWRTEVELWEAITDLPAEKRGIAVALSIPENELIRQQVMEEMEKADLSKADGLEALLNFMELKLGKDDIQDCLDKYEDFKYCKRTSGQKVTDYIVDFEQKYNRILKKKIILPQEILCFELIGNACLEKAEKLLVLSGIDFDKKTTLFDQAKRALRKFKGDLCTEASTNSLKLEPVFESTCKEECNATWHQRGGRGYGRGHGWQGKRPGFHYKGGNHSNAPGSNRPINPLSGNGARLTCHSCGSYRHLVAECPHSYENSKDRNKVNMVKDESSEQVALYTGYDAEARNQLGEEALNCAVLDTACTSTVCGKRWFDVYLDSLSAEERRKVVVRVGHKTFKFGGGERLKSIQSCTIPCTIANKSVTIDVDVVESNIPMLLSLSALKSARVKVDMETDSAEILGSMVPLDFTSSGHYCIPLKSQSVELACYTRIQEMDDVERKAALVKLHRQFAHPSQTRLKALLEDAGACNDVVLQDLEGIYSSCETCKLYAKTPARPVVSLPMATRFNEMVAMDLKVLKDKRYILHMIDMFTRLSVSVFVPSKQPKDIVNAVVLHWIGGGWGVMEGILVDNGGEFNNDHMREMGSLLNIRISTTGAESPWSNGLCERNHAVTDRMLEILRDENPTISVDVLLAWANVAKNSMHMVNGFSSYQLVLGKNPNLPNIYSDKLPALQGTTTSDILQIHLNAMHSARRAYSRCESDERIRRALRHRVRSMEERFCHGDLVYYKKENSNRWQGPAKVIFQDGSVLFVRHGSVYVRASINRVSRGVIDSSATADSKSAESVNQTGGLPTRGVIDSSASADSGDTESVGPTSTVTVSEDISASNPANELPKQCDQDTRSDTRPNPAISRIATDSPLVMNRPTLTDVKKNDVIEYQLTEEDDWQKAEVLGRAGKATTATKHWFNVREVDGQRKSLNLSAVHALRRIQSGEENVNVVTIPYQRHSEAECVAAKLDELSRLKEYEVYEEVAYDNQPCVSTTWVLVEKPGGVRARLVARGFEEDASLVKDSPTAAKSTLRILVTIAASYGWTVKSTDIRSAFLQGDDIAREVYILPPVEADATHGCVWKLRKTLYGLVDAARKFYNAISKFLLMCGMTRSTVDPSLFFLKNDERLVGCLITHIDDFLHIGDDWFESNVMNKLRQRFVAGKSERDDFFYVGFRIRKVENGIECSQDHFADKVQHVSLEASRVRQSKDDLSSEEKTLFRRLVGQCNWAAQGTRPDLSFDVVDLSSRFQNPTVSDLLKAQKLISRLKSTRCYISFPQLADVSGWRVLVFTDASLGNLSDGVSSAAGCVVCVVDGNGNCSSIAWGSSKIRRVVRSTLSAEMLAMVEGADLAIYLRHILTELIATKWPIPIHAIVDNKSTVDTVHSTHSVDDKRLRIDVGYVKQLLEQGVISSISWVPGSRMIANVLTKRGAPGSQILSLLQSGKCEVSF